MPTFTLRTASIATAVLAGLALLLFAALLVTRSTLARRTAERDTAIASLATCKAAVANQNDAIEALGKAGEAQRQAAERALAAARDKAANSPAVRALEHSARAPTAVGCATSSAFKQAVGDL
ncbi:hypothetical protein [Sphingomonas sp.]|uniref:hypothetical protein n=1 Tax=Sphingomonas sp. TaxID=28214 RepID=UPI001B29D2BD|nr:hypothetical protein [Sphingomonas sp.]MBO9713171.1 hypothetical protein [Sphingomonas sp.]